MTFYIPMQVDALAEHLTKTSGQEVVAHNTLLVKQVDLDSPNTKSVVDKRLDASESCDFDR